MRFELTTATLEGWSSTIELCPPLLWAGVVSNHRRPKPMDLQSIPFSHSGTYPFSGADGGTQTPDRSITSRMLYQLSYIGSNFCRKKSFKYNSHLVAKSKKIKSEIKKFKSDFFYQPFFAILSIIPYFLASSADMKKSLSVSSTILFIGCPV